jgi:hypothetical protein
MSLNNWTKPEIHEALVTLYMRLNGYFTTGLVVHSPEWGNNRTEIDCLAVRHPNHSQPDRIIETSPFLRLQDDRIDLLICEVKSDPEKVAFNERLWSDPEVLIEVLKWAGLLSNDKIPQVAEQLRPILRDGLKTDLAQEGAVATNDLQVRGLLCCPPATNEEVPNGWCLLGTEIFRYANECFNPDPIRDSCSTRYSFNLWGAWLTPIVKYFKDLEPAETPTLDAVYAYLGVDLSTEAKIDACTKAKLS